MLSYLSMNMLTLLSKWLVWPMIFKWLVITNLNEIRLIFCLFPVQWLQQFSSLFHSKKRWYELSPVSSLFDFNSDRIVVRILEILIHSCYYFMFYWLVRSFGYPLDFLIFSFSLLRRFRFRSVRLFRWVSFFSVVLTFFDDRFGFGVSKLSWIYLSLSWSNK